MTTYGRLHKGARRWWIAVFDPGSNNERHYSAGRFAVPPQTARISATTAEVRQRALDALYRLRKHTAGALSDAHPSSTNAQAYKLLTESLELVEGLVTLCEEYAEGYPDHWRAALEDMRAMRDRLDTVRTIEHGTRARIVKNASEAEALLDLHYVLLINGVVSRLEDIEDVHWVQDRVIAVPP